MAILTRAYTMEYSQIPIVSWTHVRLSVFVFVFECLFAQQKLIILKQIVKFNSYTTWLYFRIAPQITNNGRGKNDSINDIHSVVAIPTHRNDDRMSMQDIHLIADKTKRNDFSVRLLYTTKRPCECESDLYCMNATLLHTTTKTHTRKYGSTARGITFAVEEAISEALLVVVILAAYYIYAIHTHSHSHCLDSCS